MKKISGDISLMSLPDIMQWAETGKKSGTLTISCHGITKAFYLQDGKIIFVSSQKEGERLGEYFSRAGLLKSGQIEASLRESRSAGIPFTGYLIENGIMESSQLEHALEELAEAAFTDALTWQDGTFEFSDYIPSLILNGPVMLNTSFVVFQSVKRLDEQHRGKDKDMLDVGTVIKQIAAQISNGDIDIPPLPDMMVKLNDAMAKDNISIHDIVKIVMADQILTSKILRVSNSAFYSPASEITSLQQAIIFMGLKSVFSIATVHTLSAISPGNTEEIKSLLRHSLLCAFIAKKIAISLRLDPEEAFVCGLLHDIGKTLVLNIIEERQLSDDIKQTLMRDYHAPVGFMLGSKWHFSEVIKSSIKYHHSPQDASDHKKMVEIIHISDMIANEKDIMETVHNCSNLDFDKIREVEADIEKIKGSVISII